MFENKTSTVIENEMLAGVSDEYDKTEGSFIYDVTKPAADQFQIAYQALDAVVNLFDVENLSGELLQRFVSQRAGITVRPATFAIGQLEVRGNGTISEGDLFQTESGIQFEATETVHTSTSGTVDIRAVVAGVGGNVPANQITLMSVTLEGIDSVNNPSPTHDGFNQESDADLRTRYYERLRTPATSGNKYHYYNWAKEVAGVGNVKVFPLWNGDNTVKVVIIDVNAEPASTELVEQVQSHIDPGVRGLGEGVAPIGAYATVVSATPHELNLSFSLTILDGYTLEEVTENIRESITSYLRSIAFNQSFVSYAQIGNYILDSKGVLDYTGLTVNGGTANIAVGEEEVAVLGGVEIV